MYCGRKCNGVCRKPNTNRTQYFQNLFDLTFDTTDECLDMAQGVCRSTCYVCLKSKKKVATDSSYCQFFK